MPCEKCRTMMEIKAYYHCKNSIVYIWICPKCGHKKETKEGKE